MTQNRPAEERRDHIIAAAEAVIERDGMGAASTRAIAREAGCTLSTLHYLFPSKDDIFEAVIAQQRRELDLVPVRADESDLTGRIAEILAWYAANANDRPRYYVAQYELMAWALKTAPGAATRSNAAHYVDQYEADLKRHASDRSVDFRRLALLVLFQVEGIIVQTINGVFANEMSESSYRRLAEGLLGTCVSVGADQ